MPEPIRYPELGRRLDTLRREKGMSIRRVSKEVGADYSHTHRIFQGQTCPGRGLLVSICRSLHCSLPEAQEIFSLTDYRLPLSEELDEEPLACPA